ncbi:MAG: ATP-binding protein, partial [Acidimicrobiales bacterium]
MSLSMMGYAVGQDGVATQAAYRPSDPRGSSSEGPGERRAWLERRIDRVLDELAGELSIELGPIADQPDAILAKLGRAGEFDWPSEVVGYWVAAAKRAGCSWLQISRRLELSKHEAIERLSAWEARFSAQVVHAPGNLPVPLTSFVGREADRAEVARLMGACRVVTLTGAPGVGKSRLALQVARQEAPSHPGGAWWVDLAPLADGRPIAAAVAASLSVPEQAGRPLIDSLTTYLRELRLVLVLDNCEHLLDGCATLVANVLGSCPGISVLATSRAPLGVVGEAVWTVPTLSLPSVPAVFGSTFDGSGNVGARFGSDAVTLFCQRAEAAHADWTLTPECAPVVHEICRRLDGIPLAIELAAARVGSLSPAQILERLDECLGLQEHGPVPSASRHQSTLGRALDWSHELLSAPERTLFRRVSVFAGGFTLAAAEAICVGGELDSVSVLGLLRCLADRSLVVPVASGSEGRYGMLETMRYYAKARLAEAGEQETTAARHAGWCRQLVETAEPELTGAAQRQWFDLLEKDFENLQVALHWAQDTGAVDTALAIAGGLILFWRVHGRFSEGRRSLESALAAGLGDPAARAKALWG